jgi:hypothetical protein
VQILLSGSLRFNLVSSSAFGFLLCAGEPLLTPQDPFGDHDDAELNDALQSSGLGSIRHSETGVSTPQRLTLETQISAGGSNLSQGQRQLVALARALVRDSKVFILDEVGWGLSVRGSCLRVACSSTLDTGLRRKPLHCAFPCSRRTSRTVPSSLRVKSLAPLSAHSVLPACLDHQSTSLLCLCRSNCRAVAHCALQATASVDFETDALIQKSIRDLPHNTTVLTVAHRLATVMDYDKILVLGAGKLLEFDTPDNLKNKKDSYFAKLVQAMEG